MPPQPPSSPDRRRFLAATLTTSALAALEPAFSAASTRASSGAPPASVPTPVGNPPAGAPPSGAPPSGGTPPSDPFPLDELTIADLQACMKSGRYTARRITELYLARIDALDRRDLALNSVLEINPDALSIADALDRERKQRGPRGPLHGIPILLKDNIATHDRMTTTAGSLALEGSIPPRDSFVAARLRGAGAILLGKTNLSEWANFRSTHSSSGWSGRGGQCRNPYALDRSPSGSSSGSGVAVAANFAAAAIGSETDGSIVSPASMCSLVGIKPTIGLVSAGGIIPISPSQDTAGPMARTVADAALLLSILATPDPNGPSTLVKRADIETDYAKFLKADGLKGARIGVVREHYFGYSRATDRIAEQALEIMKQQGATLIDSVSIPGIDKLDQNELTVLLYEFKASLNRYLAGLGPGAPVHSLQEVIAFNKAHRDREMPFFEQELLEQAEAKGPLTDQAYLDALSANVRLTRSEGIDAVMHEHQLDALTAPTGGPPWLIDLVGGDTIVGGSSSLAAVAGYPAITVPAGFVYGLPIGISFFGRAWSEATLIKLAYAYEQATHHRKPPTFAATADLKRP